MGTAILALPCCGSGGFATLFLWQIRGKLKLARMNRPLLDFDCGESGVQFFSGGTQTTFAGEHPLMNRTGLSIGVNITWQGRLTCQHYPQTSTWTTRATAIGRQSGGSASDQMRALPTELALVVSRLSCRAYACVYIYIYIYTYSQFCQRNPLVCEWHNAYICFHGRPSQCSM